MHDAAYIKRRDEIQTYFDRTALEAWKRLTSTEKVSGVRATVRAGREAMRAEILSRFPRDLSGWRSIPGGAACANPGYSSPSTRSNSPASKAAVLVSGWISVR